MKKPSKLSPRPGAGASKGDSEASKQTPSSTKRSEGSHRSAGNADDASKLDVTKSEVADVDVNLAEGSDKD